MKSVTRVGVWQLRQVRTEHTFYCWGFAARHWRIMDFMSTSSRGLPSGSMAGFMASAETEDAMPRTHSSFDVLGSDICHDRLGSALDSVRRVVWG